MAGWHGRLQVVPVEQGGAAAASLRHLLVRSRQGGERFALAPGAPARSLKKQFQARALPAWAREGPLLFTADEQLLFVPGLGIDARRWAPTGEPQWGLSWCPDAAGMTGRRQPGR